MISLRPLLGFLACASLLLGPSGHLLANGNIKIPDAPVGDHRVLVTDVNVDKKQITITNMFNDHRQIYTVDDLTKVVVIRAALKTDKVVGLSDNTVANNSGSIKDIKVGQEVFDSVERDESSLDSITVGPPTDGPKIR
jgi:hypothetical protein